MCVWVCGGVCCEVFSRHACLSTAWYYSVVLIGDAMVGAHQASLWTALRRWSN